MAKDREGRRRDEKAGEGGVLPADPGPPPLMIAGQPVGKYVFAVGLFALFLGYVLLKQEFLTAAPLLIVGGLVTILAGLWNL
jgi:hypothetical protein